VAPPAAARPERLALGAALVAAVLLGLTIGQAAVVQLTSFLAAGAAAGLTVGACQWVAFHMLRQVTAQWLWASVAGGALVGLPAFLVLNYALTRPLVVWSSLPPGAPVTVLVSILAMALCGAVYGLVTGHVLVQQVSHTAPGGIINRPAPASPHHES
jgi:hypothetical protein